jgi:excisionase family DNA binding protein
VTAEMIATPWLTRELAAERALVSVKTIDKWTRTGRLKVEKPSRNIVRIHVDELDKAIRNETADD